MTLALHRPYQPRGAALALLTDRRPEILLSGPAGTGKSRAAMEKVHLCAEKYPGLRALILRQTRESLTESALVTWETKVVPEGHPCLAGPARDSRQRYAYPNGSEVIVGGLRQSGRNLTQKVMSTEYDLIYLQEAIELQEADWERATTRLRNGKLPFQQLLADTNPDAPGHWLKRRCDRGATVLLESRHEDNPTLWDAVRGVPTPGGAAYLSRLDALTGPRKQRLRYGRWVQAEGVVYEGFDAAVHLIDPFLIPGEWPRLWDVDFGFTNPFVWHSWACDPDGRLYLTREIYHTGRLVEDHAARIRALTDGEPPPEVIVCDHDAEGRATLERHLGLSTTPAVKVAAGLKLPGIQEVASRLRPAGDGKPRLFFFRGALDAVDPRLAEQRRPTCTVEEFDSYVWDERGGARRGDVPLKEHDHGMDGLRYAVYYAETGGPFGYAAADPRESLTGRIPQGVTASVGEGDDRRAWWDRV